MLRFSFATAVTVTVVAKKLESEKLQSLEWVCSGIERVSAGIWRVLHSSVLHGDSLPLPHAEETVIDNLAALALAVTKVFCIFVSIGYKRIVYQQNIITSYFTQRKLRNYHL